MKTCVMQHDGGVHITNNKKRESAKNTREHHSINLKFIISMGKSILYHGTNARIIKMSKEQRKEYTEACYTALPYLWTFYEPYNRLFEKKVKIAGQEGLCTVIDDRLKELDQMISKDEYPYLYSNLVNAFAVYESMIKGCGQYQYGDLYLTSSIHIACNYACGAFAFGEIGLITYRMYQGIQAIGFESWNPDEKTRNAIEKIKGFAEGTPDPVVIPLVNYDIQDVQRDDGTPIDSEDLKMVGHFRYKGDIQLSLENAVYIAGKNPQQVKEELNKVVEKLSK